jgi:OTU domain-containing protein 3
MTLGNCLFSALSDQIHGSPALATEIRQTCIRYMKEHEDHFKKFIEVHPGGGTRRNPKRKNVASAPVSVYHEPTDEERTRAFDNHLDSMAQAGTWGGHLEITAFVGAYNCRVNIWQSHIVYDVGGVEPSLGSLTVDPRVAHIFYHVGHLSPLT